MIDFSEQDISHDLALNAFHNTSHIPEKRAAGIIRDYMNHVEALAEEFSGYATDENREGIQVDLERYRVGYIEKLNAWLYSHSNVASAFIVGPAKFPTARNRKRSDWADNKRNAFLEYQTKVLKKLRQKYNPDLLARAPVKSDDPEAIEKLTVKLAQLESLQEAMKASNKIVRSKKLPDDEKVKKLVDLGMSEVAAHKLLIPDDYTGRTGYARYQLSNNSANIRRIKERIEDLKKAESAPAAEDQEYDGFIVRENKDLNRIQVIFPGKPGKEVISTLKRFGFNWSRRNTAWQRILNANGRRAAELFVQDYNNS